MSEPVNDVDIVFDVHPDPDDLAKELIRLNEDFSRRYPGVLFVFLSSVPLDEYRHQTGIVSNLVSVEGAFEFLRSTLSNHDHAKTRIITQSEDES